jgi:hypothetical protein
VARATATLPLVDLAIEEPPLEEVMRELFARPHEPAAGGS